MAAVDQRAPSRPASPLAVRVVAVLAYALLFVPLATVVVSSFLVPGPAGERPTLGVDLYWRLFADPARSHLWMQGRRVYDERGFHEAWISWTNGLIGAKFIVESGGQLGQITECQRLVQFVVHVGKCASGRFVQRVGLVVVAFVLAAGSCQLERQADDALVAVPSSDRPSFLGVD